MRDEIAKPDQIAAKLDNTLTGIALQLPAAGMQRTAAGLQRVADVPIYASVI